MPTIIDGAEEFFGNRKEKHSISIEVTTLQQSGAMSRKSSLERASLIESRHPTTVLKGARQQEWWRSLDHLAVLRLRSFNNNNAETTRCVLSLKAKPVLINWVSRVEEDEEEIEPLIGKECLEEASKLGAIESRVIKRCKDEFGIDGDVGFVCLGGFENVRKVYDRRGLKLEVDESKFSFGVCYEVECENDDPERVKREL
ncbi:hypothetical protein DKX38_009186 [Salix brachista]|uniref:CYTH domain-containing protein n=1 Tax=Salix brachista TaxID=2182728 RepID=A0A5N5M9U8_9ROSI|nr:hypothetical protein DKX38_009186 [Salix brachista]